jgi:hypothetical protein
MTHRPSVQASPWLGLAILAVSLSPAAAQNVRPFDNASGFGATLALRQAPPDPVHRYRRVLKPGMVVLSRDGKHRVGLITQVGLRRDGRPAVRLLVSGTGFRVDASKFRLTRRGDEAIIKLTSSQIRTSAILNTD